MKKALAVLLIFTLSVSQVGQSCRGENVNPVAVAQKDKGETMEKEISQQELNAKVLARLIELETKIDETQKIKKESIFLRILKAPFKLILFILKEPAKCVEVLIACGTFAFIYLIKSIKGSISEVKDCMKSAIELFKFLSMHKELADGILNKLFEEVSGNHGDHEPTLEEKKKFLDFLKKILRIFSPENVKNLKNLNEKDAEKIYMLASGLENQLKGK